MAHSATIARLPELTSRNVNVRRHAAAGSFPNAIGFLVAEDGSTTVSTPGSRMSTLRVRVDAAPPIIQSVESKPKVASFRHYESSHCYQKEPDSLATQSSTSSEEGISISAKKCLRASGDGCSSQHKPV